MPQTRAGSDPDSPPYPGAPRWVKAFSITAGLVVVLLLVLKLIFGGHAQDPEHHAPTGDGIQAPAAEHGTSRP
jgi:hypothetical protein